MRKKERFCLLSYGIFDKSLSTVNLGGTLISAATRIIDSFFFVWGPTIQVNPPLV
jgi:hypothetical protein